MAAQAPKPIAPLLLPLLADQANGVKPEYGLTPAGREQATAAETALGMQVLRSGASQEGAARFAAGEGRGGKF